MRNPRFKFLLNSSLSLLTLLATSPIIYSYFKENEMKKEKVKKVVKTKATLVAELEVAIRVDKGFLNSLERANAETIKRLIDICS